VRIVVDLFVLLVQGAVMAGELRVGLRDAIVREQMTIRPIFSFGVIRETRSAARSAALNRQSSYGSRTPLSLRSRNRSPSSSRTGFTRAPIITCSVLSASATLAPYRAWCGRLPGAPLAAADGSSRTSVSFTNWMEDRLQETTADPTRRLFRRHRDSHVLARLCVAWGFAGWGARSATKIAPVSSQRCYG
jgi:hypothetical protein